MCSLDGRSGINTGAIPGERQASLEGSFRRTRVVRRAQKDLPQPQPPLCSGVEKGMEADDLLCSQNAHDEKDDEMAGMVSVLAEPPR